jgi:UDP-glucose 4-epimerase
MNLDGVRVLVTGGAGFIGSHTVDALVNRGAQVSIVDNCSTGRLGNVNPRARLYALNVGDSDLDRVLADVRPEVIYHFAYFVKVPESLKNPLLDMDVLAGSIRMLQKAVELGAKRIVFASSGFLYGNTPHLPATEDLPVEPITPYVVTKHTIEHYLEFYRKIYSIAYTVVRYAAIYGPRQVTGAMADYIRKLASGGQAEIWGDGNKTRDYVYIDDVVRANLLALDVPLDYQKPIFNIGTSKETTLNSVYQKIARILGVEPRPIYHPDRPGEQIRYCLDNAKARRDLGWKPQWNLDEGLRMTIGAYAKIPCLLSKYVS